jgi:hypothetical protein
LPLTVKATPTLADAGDDAVDAVTLTSVVALTAVVALTLVMLLLAELESTTWSWSTAIEAVEVKLWLDGPVQVTDQEAFRGVAVDWASEVFWTVTGLVLLVVQSPGNASVNVVSTTAGVTGPLLWTVALPVTVKATPTLAEAGADAVDAVTFTSVLAVTAVVALTLVRLLLRELESTTWSWSTAKEAVDVKLWFDGPVHVTDQEAFRGVAVDWASDVF